MDSNSQEHDGKGSDHDDEGLLSSVGRVHRGSTITASSGRSRVEGVRRVRDALVLIYIMRRDYPLQNCFPSEAKRRL